MTNCIVHVGMHKTGSSSIQQSLAGLSDAQFHYAELGASPNHGGPIRGMFSEAVVRHTDQPNKLRKVQRHKVHETEYAAQLDATVKAAGSRTVIISGEAISFMDPGSIARFKQFLDQRFDSVQIVAYVRPLASLLVSLFQQRVSFGRLSALEFDATAANYRDTFDKFDQVFGRNAVILWKFDPSNFPGGDVVRDFCARLGIDLPEDRRQRSNPSISRELLALLFSYRRYLASTDAGNEDRSGFALLRTAFDGFGSGKIRFSPDLISAAVATRRADLQWMEERLGQSLSEDTGPPLPGDIASEGDLLRPDPATVAKLLEILGENAPPGVRGATAGELGLLASTCVAIARRAGKTNTPKREQRDRDANLAARNAAERTPRHPAAKQRRSRLAEINSRLVEIKVEMAALKRERQDLRGRAGPRNGDRRPERS